MVDRASSVGDGSEPTSSGNSELDVAGGVGGTAIGIPSFTAGGSVANCSCPRSATTSKSTALVDIADMLGLGDREEDAQALPELSEIRPLSLQAIPLPADVTKMGKACGLPTLP